MSEASEEIFGLQVAEGLSCGRKTSFIYNPVDLQAQEGRDRRGTISKSPELFKAGSLRPRRGPYLKWLATEQSVAGENPTTGRELPWMTVPWMPFNPGTSWLDNMNINESFLVLISTVGIPSGSHFPQGPVPYGK